MKFYNFLAYQTHFLKYTEVSRIKLFACERSISFALSKERLEIVLYLHFLNFREMIFIEKYFILPFSKRKISHKQYVVFFRHPCTKYGDTYLINDYDYSIIGYLEFLIFVRLISVLMVKSTGIINTNDSFMNNQRKISVPMMIFYLHF